MFDFTIILIPYHRIHKARHLARNVKMMPMETAADAEAEDGNAATDSSHLFQTLNISQALISLVFVEQIV